MGWNNEITDRLSRRSVLKATAAGVAGTGTPNFQFERESDRVFELNCSMSGWKVMSPPDMAGRINPTLPFEAGTTYTIKWTNTDGFRHNFVLLDQDGNQLIRTGYVTEAGESQVVRFTATAEMAQYMCEVHPESMQGRIDIAGREQRPLPFKQETIIPPGDSIGLVEVAGGLDQPLDLQTAPGLEDRLFVVGQTGKIHVLAGDGSGVREDPFLDISERMVDLGVKVLRGYDQRGLLGLAFHPNFRENRRFFVHYSAPRREGTPDNYDHTEVVSEFEATEDLEGGLANSENVLLEIPSPQFNHNGGEMAFGPDDGYLYVGMGDGGEQNDTGPGHVEDWFDDNDGGNGQDVTENLLGSVLRIDVDSGGDGGYGIPDDNPLVGTEGLNEQYAWGFRNPWKLSFGPNGRLFVADTGQNRFESVYSVQKGGNYAWNVKEGTHCFTPARPSLAAENTGPCPDTTPEDVRGGEQLREPFIQYPHRFRTTSFHDGSAVIGGNIYDGGAVGHLQNKYVLGNWSGLGVRNPDGEIFVATEPSGGSAGGTLPLEELVIAGSPTGKLNRYVYAFGQDPSGEFYVVTNTSFRPKSGANGQVFRIVPPGQGERIPVPDPQNVSEGPQQ